MGASISAYPMSISYIYKFICTERRWKMIMICVFTCNKWHANKIAILNLEFCLH